MKTKILNLFWILLTFSKLTLWSGENKEEPPYSASSYKNNINLFTNLEFIYWKTIQDNLFYATTGVTVNANSMYHPFFSWSSGFKAGIGAFFLHDQWDIYTNYTQLNSHASNQVKNNTESILAIEFVKLDSNQVNQFILANGYWSLHFHVIDVELGKSVYLSHLFNIRLFGGFKFAWKDQSWENHYVANQVTIGDTSSNGTALTKYNQNVYGIGIRIGENGNWYFYRSWSITTKLAFSSSWLNYHNHRSDQVQKNEAPGMIIQQIKKDNDTLKAIIELFLGLYGEWWFSQERYHLVLQGGFDEQLWINFGEFIFLLPRGNGDFSMNGLTLKARLDF